MINFNGIIESMKEHGMDVPTGRKTVNVENAKEAVMSAFDYFISMQGGEAEWIKPYDQVSEWLEDNKGRGLLMYGGCGLGKTMLARFIIPAVLLKCSGKVVKYVDAQQMNKELDGLFHVPILAIDDIGTEEVVNHYGNKRVALLELVDNAEKNGNLLILTTNLTGEGLQEKYGERALDRIFSTMERVPFNGKSFRRKQ